MIPVPHPRLRGCREEARDGLSFAFAQNESWEKRNHTGRPGLSCNEWRGQGCPLSADPPGSLGEATTTWTRELVKLLGHPGETN